MSSLRSLRGLLLLSIALLSVALVVLGGFAWTRLTATPPAAPEASDAPRGTVIGFGFGPPKASPPQPITPTNAGTLIPQRSSLTLPTPRLTWGIDQQLLARGQAATARFDPMLLGLAIELVPRGTLLAVSPDGRTTIRRATDGPSEARVVELDTKGAVLRTLAPGVRVASATFLSGGSVVALASADAPGVTLWEVATGTRVGALSGFAPATPTYTIRVAEDGRRAAWLAGSTVQFHDVAKNALGTTLRLDAEPTASMFTGDGQRFVTVVPGSGGGLIQWWDLETGKETARATDATGAAPVLAASPDGKVIATANRAGVQFWAADSTRPIGRLDVPNAVDVAFSLDGFLVATASEDGNLIVWKVP